MSIDDVGSAWLVRYGTDLVHPRQAVEDALVDPDAFRLFSGVVERWLDQPAPAALNRYLAKRENLFFRLEDGSTYRFAREGHRWRLARVPEEVLAQLVA